MKIAWFSYLEQLGLIITQPTKHVVHILKWHKKVTSKFNNIFVAYEISMFLTIPKTSRKDTQWYLKVENN